MMSERTMTIFECMYPTYKIKKPIRLIELFAGIGAQAKALENLKADFEHYKVIEFDKYAMRSYNAIHGTDFEISDIRDIHADDLSMRERERFCYIMTYSFPCQDLSPVGKKRGLKKGENTRSGLLWEVERILDECDDLPEILLMENVPNVIGTQNINDFQKWETKLESIGYSNYIQILNAKDYGIPQNRERCFMISIHGKYNYTFPNKIALNDLMSSFLDDNVDSKYYLSQKLIDSFVENEQKQIIKNNGFRFKVTDGNVIASTITTKEGSRMENNYIGDIEAKRVRRLTPSEAWKLMGFSSEDYEKAKKVNSDSQLYKQAGNSIVVNVLEAIFRNLIA